MKYSQYIGILAAVLLVLACFIPWAYYPDLDKTFTGFFSEQNKYGRPGILLSFLALLCTVLYLIPRIWAKRTNLVLTSLCAAFSIRCFLVFSACYRGNCPVKHAGLYLLVASSLFMVLAALLPDISIQEDGK